MLEARVSVVSPLAMYVAELGEDDGNAVLKYVKLPFEMLVEAKRPSSTSKAELGGNLNAQVCLGCVGFYYVQNCILQ